MFSHKHPSHQSHYQPTHSFAQQTRGWGNMPPRPPIQEDTLKSAQVQIERKSFMFTLRENPRGRLLRISEETNGRRNAIIIPSTGLEEFAKIVAEMAKAASELPPTQEPPQQG